MNFSIYRQLDVIFSIMGLLFGIPIMFFIFFFAYLDTGAPIFQQKRLGKNQTIFTLFKFRTMTFNTTSVATHLIDPSLITPFGKFLRVTKLDEIPQLWNVLKGDMSFVGPRPGLPNQSKLTKARNKRGIFNVRPGITGLAQVQGIDMSTPELLAKIDAEMIATISVKNYFKYIFQTVMGKGAGDRTRL